MKIAGTQKLKNNYFFRKICLKKVEIKTKTLNSVLPSKNLSKYFLKIDV